MTRLLFAGVLASLTLAACQPAAPTAQPDLSWQWVCSPHQVWLAAVAWGSPEVAVRA